MILSNLKIKIAAYCNRDVGSFVVNGFDVLTDGINQARRWAQLTCDFEYCKTRANLDVSFAKGGYLSKATLIDDTNSNLLVDVKKVEAAYIQLPNTSSDVNGYSSAGTPIKVYSRWNDSQRQRRVFSGTLTYGYPNSSCPQLRPNYNDIALIVQNNQVYFTPGVGLVYPSVSFLTLALDIIAFQPDLALDTDQDFFTIFCNQWLCAYTIVTLQMYLKEDERIALYSKIADKEWNTVLSWNEQIAGQDDGDLE